MTKRELQARIRKNDYLSCGYYQIKVEEKHQDSFYLYIKHKCGETTYLEYVVQYSGGSILRIYEIDGIAMTSYMVAQLETLEENQ